MAAARLPEELERVAEDLYGLPPEAFTAARADAVKRARAAGDKELARAVGGLRRPAVAAWAVNLLVRERVGLLDQVTSMGDSLREAQAQLDGEALRDLARHRRRLVAAVTAEVAAVAAAQDHALSAAASRQVEETVQAALVDPQAAAAVRSGVLVAPLSSTGVDSLAEVLGVPLPADAPDAGPPARGPSAPVAGPSGRPSLSLVTADEEAARREAQERLVAAEKAARKAAKVAGKARDKALAARDKAQARVLQQEAAVEELRRGLADAETAAEEAASRLAAREAALEEAVAAADATARDAEAAADAVRRAAPHDRPSRPS